MEETTTSENDTSVPGMEGEPSLAEIKGIYNPTTETENPTKENQSSDQSANVMESDDCRDTAHQSETKLVEAVTAVDCVVEEPKIGLLFESMEHLMDYYTRYGKQVGFSVSKRTSSKGDFGELRYQTIVCTKSGKPRSETKSPFRVRTRETKTECKARINAAITADGGWRITGVVLQHNHELCQSDQALPMSKKSTKKSATKRKTCSSYQIVGSGTNKKSVSPVAESHSYKNIPVLEIGLPNRAERESKLQLRQEDEEAIHCFFHQMKAKNTKFFYTTDMDNQGQIRHVFWADARSKASFHEFGDVVTIDTRYLAQKWELPLVTFLGVNHHGQTILFGCGLMASDDVDGYTWVLNSFLTCNGGNAPTAIVSDQDKELQKAIEALLPNTRFRWCLWLIMRKLPEKLRGHGDYECIKLAFENAVYGSFIEDEFVRNWGKMIEKFNLQTNEWLVDLYAHRKRWVPLYVKEYFWAGMSIAEQTESLKSFFDEFVNSDTTLKQFTKLYEAVVRSMVEKENREDFCSFNSYVPCVTHYDMEKQIQEAYTASKFKEFQAELIAKMYCDIAFSREENAQYRYEVMEDVRIGERRVRRNFSVLLSGEDRNAKCSCRLFEFRGILCRHIITIFLHTSIDFIPLKYILRRWRKDLKRAHNKIRISYDEWRARPDAERFEKMCNFFYEVADLAAASDDSCRVVMNSIRELKGRLEQTGVCPTNQALLKTNNDISFSGGGGNCGILPSRDFVLPGSGLGA